MMAENEDGNNLGREVDRIERRHFVGRIREIQLFTNLLSGRPDSKRILNVYGTGGVGKSYLLDEFRRISGQANVPFLLLDSRDLPKTPSSFCLYLLRMLRGQAAQAEQTEMDCKKLANVCVQAIHAAAEQRSMVVAFDTFEEMGELEQWLRDHLLVHFKPDIVVVIAGRLPLQGRWHASPGWRQLIDRMPLDDLDYPSVRQYLNQLSITEEHLVQSVWLQSQGHPLTFSLLAAIAGERSLQTIAAAKQHDVFRHIVDVWLSEVADSEMRDLIRAAAVLRHFHQELLSHVLEKQVTAEQFAKLTSYSFVRMVGHGWQMHDLMREAVQHELRLRVPAYFNKLWKRCILYYYRKIVQSPNKRLSAWESGEWVYYTAGLMVRTMFYQQTGTYQLEPLHPSNWHEAAAYIQHRYTSAADRDLFFTNPDTGEWTAFHFTAADGLQGLKHLPLEELYRLDPNIVSLARNAQGTVCGLSVFIPIHGHTLAFLQSSPLSSAYFSGFSATKLKELRETSTAGFFVYALDAYDISDVPLLQALLSRFFNLILSTGYVVAAPPAHPFWHTILQAVGAEMIKENPHFDYDGETPTPVFVVDIRGRRLSDYLNRVMASHVMQEEMEAKDDRLHELTRREKEVIRCLMKGLTNSEIADELCLSEATVKKHVTNAFKKLAVKNRVQLANRYAGVSME